MSREEIQVLYTIMDRTGNYSKLTATSICSLLENTKEKIYIHLFHDGTLNDDNKQKFGKMIRAYKQKIEFYNVHSLLPDTWVKARNIFSDAMNSQQYTEAALYRLVAHQILPYSIKKLIYLDSDTIINMDIKELWKKSLGNTGMGAVREADLLLHYGMKPTGESKEKMYEHMQDVGVNLNTCFNSGVLLIDLDKMRKHGDILLNGLQILAKYPQDNFFYDQNILNYYFAKDLTPLPWNYNILQHWDREHSEPKIVKGIYHYMGKTLDMNGYDVRDTIYYDYFIKTPWCDGEFFCRIHKVMNSVYLQLLGPRIRAMRKLIAILGKKQLVIAYTEENKLLVKKLMSKPDDFDNEESKNSKEKKEMSKIEREYEWPDNIKHCSLGKEENLLINLPYDVDLHLYLLFVKDYNKVKTIFQNAGLKEKEHFMGGGFLLSGKPWLENIIQPNKFFELL